MSGTKGLASFFILEHVVQNCQLLDYTALVSMNQSINDQHSALGK
jgi:hypothetical protein